MWNISILTCPISHRIQIWVKRTDFHKFALIFNILAMFCIYYFVFYAIPPPTTRGTIYSTVMSAKSAEKYMTVVWPKVKKYIYDFEPWWQTFSLQINKCFFSFSFQGCRYTNNTDSLLTVQGAQTFHWFLSIQSCEIAAFMVIKINLAFYWDFNSDFFLIICSHFLKTQNLELTESWLKA